MKLRSVAPGLTTEQAGRPLSGMPTPGSYHVVVKPSRYRTQPHRAAWTSLDDHKIVLQLPDPFHAFEEMIPHTAGRLPGKGM